MMKFLIDVHKIPRPERSGLISMLCLYVFLTAVSDIQGASYPEFVSLHGWRAIACYLMPCSMLPGFYRKEDPPSQWRPIRLVTMLAGAKGKHVCTCHLEMMNKSGGVIERVLLAEEPRCDSYTPDPSLLDWWDSYSHDYKLRERCE